MKNILEYKAFLAELKELGMEEDRMATTLFQEGYTSIYNLARCGVSNNILARVDFLLAQKAASQTSSQINVTIGNIYVLDGKADLKTMLALAGISGVEPKQVSVAKPKAVVAPEAKAEKQVVIASKPILTESKLSKFSKPQGEDEDEEEDYNDY